MCQKLFYDNPSVVNTVPDATSNVELDDVVCPEGRIGPNCLLYCKSDVYNHTCKEHVICYEEGCTCPPGFRGENCALSCEKNRYGYGCNQMCGSCNKYRMTSSLDTCNKVTGACTAGCTYDQNILYIPPLCKMDISKPVAPTIDTVSNTNIQVNVPVEWKDEYKALLEYAFTISSSTGNTNYTGWKRVFQNMTELTERFTNLESGVIYNIACIFRVCNQYDNMCSNYIQSNWRTAETVCNPTDLMLDSEEHSLSIDWKLDPKQPFPCPANWYRIIVQVTGKSTPLLNTTVNHFPYTVSQKLPSYTSFTVTIVHEDKKIFSDDIRTLEEVPEEPANFTVLPYNKGIVDLYWKHPWKTGSRLDHFYIMIIPLSTNLVKFLERNWRPYNSSINVTVTNYMREYTKRLYLHPSTQYHIFIKAVTVLGMSSTVQYKEFKTPSSLKFSGPLKYVMHDSMISLNIPRIVNYTKDSTIHVIVKGPLGPNGCKGYLRVPEDLQAIADIDVSHVAWEAAEISSQQDLNKSFTIGNNKMYGRAKNCQLQLKESYDITVIVTENNENSLIDPIMLKITVLNGEISSQPHHEAWLIPVILILIVAAVLLYLYRR
ncbi:hypothetical protein DMN91_000444 [Ooceraea biroi]|uniref:Fibronectin type-III domain-containing protein n=1 Tax=Ooceraea biroi TaxID=2015173 RepID=A0A3L8E1W3_OOCBI|nr:hypothetical protein DMN91_000444 [Ooceraea biroi]